MADEIKIKTKGRKLKWIVLIVVTVIILGTAVVLWMVSSKGGSAKKVEKQLSLGAKFLSEMNYEQAVAAYERAIKIDPKCAKAYIGLADAYAQLSDFENAEMMLQKGVQAVKDKNDKELLEDKLAEVLIKKEEARRYHEPTVLKIVKKIGEASVGETVVFGGYQQARGAAPDSEAVEWKVLDKKDGKVLLLSTCGLEVMPYHGKYESVTWETCSLRRWLNTEFYENAFSEVERAFISVTSNTNEDHPEAGTPGGGATEDKVFLLSVQEALNYFGGDPFTENADRVGKVTDYAKHLNAFVSEEKDKYDGNGWWWLRSPGEFSACAVTVLHDGTVSAGGMPVNYDSNVVRPAFWIDCTGKKHSESVAMPTVTPTPSPTPTPTPSPTPSPTPMPTPSPTPMPTPTPEGDGFASAVIRKELSKASVGDYVFLGNYEQDNDSENGPEAVEWLVLEKQDGKMLVLSRYGLDAIRYNEEYAAVTWENATLRRWLNEEFFQNTFSKAEQTLIRETVLSNPANPIYNTDGGNDTKDKVFLLGYEDIINYFEDDLLPEVSSYRTAWLTEYAKAKGGYALSEEEGIVLGSAELKGSGSWWLRTPGVTQENVLSILLDTEISGDGCSVISEDVVVRPAMWISCSLSEDSTVTTSPTPDSSGEPGTEPTPTPKYVHEFEGIYWIDEEREEGYYYDGTYEFFGNTKGISRKKYSVTDGVIETFMSDGPPCFYETDGETLRLYTEWGDVGYYRKGTSDEFYRMSSIQEKDKYSHEFEGIYWVNEVAAFFFDGENVFVNEPGEKLATGYELTTENQIYYSNHRYVEQLLRYSCDGEIFSVSVNGKQEIVCTKGTKEEFEAVFDRPKLWEMN